MNSIEEQTPEEFLDIIPIKDSEFDSHMDYVLSEPQSAGILKFIFPNMETEEAKGLLRTIHDKRDFQQKVMAPLLNHLQKQTTAGITDSGFEKIKNDLPATFITNHRDIVLDSSFLCYVMFQRNIETCEIAIGNNLFVNRWVESLVRINKCFVVKRNLPIREALAAAKQLSGYIRFAHDKKKQSIWIAHREGRAKDSNDLTQESLIKMLAIAGEGTIVERLKALNLSPIALSYEYDPNDYLKLQEFLLKRRDPHFKKSKQDDFISMQTGIMGYKGHINYGFAGSINKEIDALEKQNDKHSTYQEVCKIIDRAIHSNYVIYPCNYIAYDMRFSTDRFTGRYTAEQKAQFEQYMATQLAKITVPDVTAEEQAYLQEMMLKLYSNTLVNKLSVVTADDKL